MPPLALPDPPLTDGVITLREWRAEDRDAVVAALQDPEIPRWTTVPSPYGPEDFDAWLERQAEQRAGGSGLHLLITDAEDGVVGAVGFNEAHTDRPDIGYWIAAEHRGRGYAARAVRLMQEHVRRLGFQRVDLVIHPDNEASQRVARAAGFQATGELTRCPRDHGGRADHLRFSSSPSPG